MTKQLLVAAAVSLALAGCGRDEDSAANRSGTDVTPSGPTASTAPAASSPGPLQTGEPLPAGTTGGGIGGSGSTSAPMGDAHKAPGAGDSTGATPGGAASSSTGSGGVGANTPTATGNLHNNSSRP